ncbi:MAG: DUF916 domain-containing protein [Nocardiaceae bacterium]|nr:DUF916 domain-containing protein [Nocardiaceae bacterium]
MSTRTRVPRSQHTAVARRRPRDSWLIRLQIAVFLGLAAAMLPGVALGDPMGIGVRIVEVPKNLVDDPRAQSYIIDNVPPGTTLERRIAVENNTGGTREIKVYPVAAKIDSDGGFSVIDPQTNELSSWTTVNPPVLILENGQEATVNVTVSVPKTATESERYGAILAEVSSGAPTGTGVKVVNRVGIRMYLSVGPGNGPSPDFRIESMTPRKNPNGHHEVLVHVTNTGGRALDLSGQITLTDGPGGLSLPTKEGRGPTLGLTMSGDVLFDMESELPAGPWTAKATITSGLISHDAQAKITFPASGTGETVGTQPSGGTLNWLIWVLGSISAAAIALIVFLLLRTKRLRHPPDTE